MSFYPPPLSLCDFVRQPPFSFWSPNYLFLPAPLPHLDFVHHQPLTTFRFQDQGPSQSPEFLFSLPKRNPQQIITMSDLGRKSVGDRTAYSNHEPLDLHLLT